MVVSTLLFKHDFVVDHKVLIERANFSQFISQFRIAFALGPLRFRIALWVFWTEESKLFQIVAE